MEKILLTGGSGLIGTRLSDLLAKNGYRVVHLVRSVAPRSPYQQFLWNPAEHKVDAACFAGVNHIVHLAGENISAGRWSAARKAALLQSRVDTARLLFEASANHALQTFISASGVGFYGTLTSEKIFDETDPPATDFLAQLAVEWEGAAQLFEKRQVRVATVRTGVVLTLAGGALKKMYAPMKLGLGAVLGSGQQYFPWIHVDDICGIYLHLIRNKLSGAYNAVADEFVNHAEFTKALAKASGKKLMLPNAPSFLLQILLGEMADIVLKGSRVSNEKIKSAGYRFVYADLATALQDIFSRPASTHLSTP